MAPHFVCLSFDFDAVSPWIYRDMTTPTPISRGEFGIVGAERLLDLLAENDIKSTWFIPGHTIETYAGICARVHAAGHEIGHHGYLHEPPADFAARQSAEGRCAEQFVLQRGCDIIRGLAGRNPRGYRSPAWDLSEHTVGLLVEQGFTYDSSMMGHDYTPYRARTGDIFPAGAPAQFGPETELIEMPISWSTDDYPHFEFSRRGNAVIPGLQRADDVLANWTDDFDYMARKTDWGVLTYTMHPQVIGRGHRMLMLERLIRNLTDLGATFVRMEDAASWYSERHPQHRA